MNPILAVHLSLLPLADLFSPQHMGGLMALAGMSMGLGGMIIGALAAAQKRRLRHELMRTALEKGQPLPPELLAEQPPRSTRDDRRSGIVMGAIGIALYIALHQMVPNYGVKWVALIPGFVGLALLLNWALERTADDRQNKR